MRLCAFAIAILLHACTQAQDTVRTFVLADTTVKLVRYTSPLPGPLYYNMHDDENTSVEVARKCLSDSGGTLYELVHSGERNIKFYVDSVPYAIDPNRIYTSRGVWRELRKSYRPDSLSLVQMESVSDSLAMLDSLGLLNPSVWRDTLIIIDTAALDSLAPWLMLHLDSLGTLLDTFYTKDTASVADTVVLLFAPDGQDSIVFQLVSSFADTLLAIMRIDTQRLVIALHNNKEDGYSLSSYRIDSIYQDEALAIYVGTHPDPDDFYFVTERRIFETLQPNPFHIVLQDNRRMTDDGSLSVYCGMRGIHYVNVEAQHKHGKEQEKMLRLLAERLKDWW